MKFFTKNRVLPSLFLVLMIVSGISINFYLKGTRTVFSNIENIHLKQIESANALKVKALEIINIYFLLETNQDTSILMEQIQKYEPLAADFNLSLIEIKKNIINQPASLKKENALKLAASIEASFAELNNFARQMTFDMMEGKAKTSGEAFFKLNQELTSFMGMVEIFQEAAVEALKNESHAALTSITVVIWISAILVGIGIVLVYIEGRKKRNMQKIFAKYVSPAIVDQILSAPGAIDLGGIKKELTVFFTDIKDFTILAERLEARTLSDFLNGFFTTGTQLIFKNNGTLDKFIGDAIMAFWGAPVDNPSHATQACQCALEMMEQVHLLNLMYKKKGLPDISIRIGINTGTMNVGNFGSDTVRSYTVMGDTVNIAARLEGANKFYGTKILINESTYRAVKDNFICREVDSVLISGKSEPVKLFELISNGKLSPEKMINLEVFALGLAHYQVQQFAEAIEYFKKSYNFNPDDLVSKIYIQRCTNLINQPPPEDWKPVVSLTKL